MAKKLKIKNLTDVDAALKQLAELDYQKSKLEADKNLKIGTYESVYNESFQPIAEQIAELNQGVMEYLNDHKADFETVKTKKLPNGTISCKASSKLEIADEAKTMEILRKLDLNHCISVTEGLNKNAIKTLDAKTLKQAKVSIVTESKFTIKLNQTELKAVATA